MEEALYIEKDKVLRPGLDYFALRKEGVQYLQEMCGHIWTDYNEHDPGVTMLEQLCYALTSLSYLTEIPLRDLLVDKMNGRIDMDRQALFTPIKIYPANPWTAADYRRLLLDGLAWLGNAWFVPAAREDNDYSVNGLYKALLYVPLHPDVAAAKEEVKKLYAAHRNLCEDLDTVQFLTAKPIQLYAEVAFNDACTPEALLAQLFFAAGQYLAPEIGRYSLEDVLAQGLAADKIFEGPLLRNGFIRDNDLQPRADTLYLNQIEKTMLGITGVENLRNVYLKYKEEEYRQKITVPADSIWTLDTRPQPDRSFTIRFFKKGVEYKPDPVRVQSHLQRLYQQLRMRYRLDQQYEKYFGVPAGRYSPVEKYYSIQNQFPNVYGINKFGLLSSDTPERKALAKQLKGYLLVFEQLMADFQAQLAHVRDLFSIDPDIMHTYFYQGLENIVPNVAPVLKNGDDADATACDGYKKGLRKLIDRLDPFWDRRNRLLDFLLALYAEKVSEYDISPYTPHPACYSDQPLPARLLKAKLLLLKYLVTRTRDRGKAFNYLDANDKANIPGMEWKIRILLGMPLGPFNYLQEEFAARGFQLVDEQHEKLKKQIPSSPTLDDDIKNYYEAIGEDERSDDLPGARRQLLSTIAWYKEGLVDETLIAYGAHLDNYRIGLDKKSNSWELVFRPSETTAWKTIGFFKSREEGLAAALALSASLKELCCCCNRLYIVEHNLLRDAPCQDEHSFSLPADDDCRNEDVLAYHFSFHISVIFCGCSSIIDNDEYRSFAKTTVADSTPAHIVAHYYWLRPWQMLRFELLFNNWRSALSAPVKNPGLLSAASAELILFLKGVNNKTIEL